MKHQILYQTIESAFATAFNQIDFAIKLEEELNNSHRAANWENVLVDCLQLIHPSYVVERTGGKLEKNHGTDILVKMPSPLDTDTYYGVAIQVKDYRGNKLSPKEIVDQVKRAKQYWEKHNDIAIILESWIVLIGGKKVKMKN